MTSIPRFRQAFHHLNTRNVLLTSCLHAKSFSLVSLHSHLDSNCNTVIWYKQFPEHSGLGSKIRILSGDRIFWSFRINSSRPVCHFRLPWRDVPKDYAEIWLRVKDIRLSRQALVAGVLGNWNVELGRNCRISLSMCCFHEIRSYNRFTSKTFRVCVYKVREIITFIHNKTLHLFKT